MTDELWKGLPATVALPDPEPHFHQLWRVANGRIEWYPNTGDALDEWKPLEKAHTTGLYEYDDCVTITPKRLAMWQYLLALAASQTERAA